MTSVLMSPEEEQMRKIAALLMMAGAVITRCEGDTSRFNARPGDRVDIVMPTTQDPVGDGTVARCDAMGGELIAHVDPADQSVIVVLVCEGVDF